MKLRALKTPGGGGRLPSKSDGEIADFWEGALIGMES